MLLKRFDDLRSKFDDNEQIILTEYFVDTALQTLFNEKSIDRSKINLLNDIKSLSPETYTNKKDELMRHKAIQTRALVLDLISTDYSVDVKCIYKPEKWVYEILKDVENTFVDETGLLSSYNEFLVKEFEDIFINKVEKYGSNGNQLLVNLICYKRFINKFVEFDFTDLFTKIKNQIDPIKLYQDKELESIVDDCTRIKNWSQ
ncbi:hypothetical protein P3W45_000525 [Vairimorpha bombi]|jgi:hypothetical protein